MSNTSLSTPAERASYGIGLQMGEQLREVFSTVSLAAALAGIQDAFNDAVPQLSHPQIEEAFGVIQQQIQRETAEKSKHLAGEGEAFLAENAKRAEVTVTASGLQYEVISAGTGPKPTRSSTVRTHYRGTLIDGKEFDSSYARGTPAEFPVGGVIAGWTEALQIMPTGSKWRLYIPQHLAYGERGAGSDIGPFQALIFDIELLDIVR
ncbi:FKBP-type peptidyl-prolyl cis-trans isomerase [gamma proteobacterium HdN1]|nr:FKBP-type peptidyl-prolyl cis-trans isomerase [gamma proteobacterium HdN1]